MKKILKVSFLLIITLASCKKDVSDLGNSLINDDSKTVSLMDGQKFYYDQKSPNVGYTKNNVGARVSQENPQVRIAFLPNWKKAKQSTNKFFSFLEVPINKPQYLSLPETQSTKYSREEKVNMFQNMKRFLVLFRVGGKITERIVTYIPDISYIGNAKTKNTVEALTKDFTGRIEYQNIYGQKLFVIEAKNGESIKTTSYLKSSTSNQKSTAATTSGVVCQWEITDWYIYGCYNYYPDGANGPEIEVCGNVIYDGQSRDLVCEQVNTGTDCTDPANFFLPSCFFVDDPTPGPQPEPQPNPTYPLNENGLYIPGDVFAAFEIDYKARMKPAEIAVFNGLNLQQQYLYLMNAYTAEARAPHHFWDNRNGGKFDAFRHSFFHALNTHHLGKSLSEQLGNGHENYPGNDPDEKSMDLHNNKAGRDGYAELAMDANEHNRLLIRMDIENMIIREMSNGNMQYFGPNGTLIPSNQ